MVPAPVSGRPEGLDYDELIAIPVSVAVCGNCTARRRDRAGWAEKRDEPLAAALARAGVNARNAAHGGSFWRRVVPGSRRGRCLVRISQLYDGRAARRERAREPRPRAHRYPQL